MFERLDQIEAKYEELTQALASPDITNDSARYQKTAKAHSEISATVEKYREYKDLKRGIAESRAVIAEETDGDMRAYAQEELDKLESRVTAALKMNSRLLLLPKDPNDEKDVVLEIRAGTGGDEVDFVRGRNVSHVYALRRDPALEGRGALLVGVKRRWHERNHCPGRGPPSLFAAQI